MLRLDSERPSELTRMTLQVWLGALIATSFWIVPCFLAADALGNNRRNRT
jgi:hypothetical protein